MAEEAAETEEAVADVTAETVAEEMAEKAAETEEAVAEVTAETVPRRWPRTSPTRWLRLRSSL